MSSLCVSSCQTPPSIFLVVKIKLSLLPVKAQLLLGNDGFVIFFIIKISFTCNCAPLGITKSSYSITNDFGDNSRLVSNKVALIPPKASFVITVSLITVNCLTLVIDLHDAAELTSALA